MELILFLTGVLITHFYYKVGTRDQQNIFNKLSKEIKTAILEDSRQKLTIKDLNKILEEKVYDKESNEPLPYKTCPKCGNEILHKSSGLDDTRDEEYFFVECKGCGWNEWSQ